MITDIGILETVAQDAVRHAIERGEDVMETAILLTADLAGAAVRTGQDLMETGLRASIDVLGTVIQAGAGVSLAGDELVGDLAAGYAGRAARRLSDTMVSLVLMVSRDTALTLGHLAENGMKTATGALESGLVVGENLAGNVVATAMLAFNDAASTLRQLDV